MIVDGKAYRSSEVLEVIVKRDGLVCKIPECKNPTYFPKHDPPNVDHWLARANGGKDEWDNFVVAHTSCNGRKSDRLILPDGTLEPLDREPKPEKVAKRPPCETCEEGRLLLEGESCTVCGSGPQPQKFPKYNQRTPKECNHSDTFCWACTLGFVERIPASSDVFGVENAG